MSKNPTWNDVMPFSLRDNPVIFDVGGYNGDWTQIALDKYINPTIYVFEPVKEFYDSIVKRFSGNKNVTVFNIGLSGESKIDYMSVSGDASHINSEGNREIKLKNIIEFLFENKIFYVDLIKINIEGEEYNLLEKLVSTPELNVFQNFLIQFHKIDNHIERRDAILNHVNKYYDIIFNYEFIFEGWTVKKISKINCIGDSHVSICANNDLIQEEIWHTYDNFKSYRIGPQLAYTLRNKENILELFNTINKDELLLLCFGEIDCRAQVKKQMDKTNRTYTEVIDELIAVYFEFIDKLNRKNIIVLGVTPEITENPFQQYYESNDDFDKPRGTYDERNMYKNYFNSLAESECNKRGYTFVSICKNIKNINDHALDDIHLNPRKVYYLLQRALIDAGLRRDI